jgi:hypothetical protein
MSAPPDSVFKSLVGNYSSFQMSVTRWFINPPQSLLAAHTAIFCSISIIGDTINKTRAKCKLDEGEPVKNED